MGKRVDVMLDTKTLPFVLSVPEAAKIARTGTQAIYLGVRCGKIPAKRFGNIWRIPRDSFLEWLQAQ